MKLIAHRGNFEGRNESEENTSDYIITAISKGYDVEIDLRDVRNSKFMLGHDVENGSLSIDFIHEYSDRLWIHVKTEIGLYKMLHWQFKLNWFWHETDYVTLTKTGCVWTYPNRPLLPNSVCVLPEWGINGDISKCYGICSDDLREYREKYGIWEKTLQI